MQASGLTANEYRSVLDRAHRLKDYSSLQQLIRRTFSTPEILNDSFKLRSFRTLDPSTHNVDVDFVNRFYYDTAVNNSLPHELLPEAIVTTGLMKNELLKSLEGNAQQTNMFLPALFILTMCGQLCDTAATSVLNRLSTVTASLPEVSRQILMRWFAELDGERLRRLVEALNRSLTVDASKLLPDSSEKSDLKQAVANMMAVLRFLQLLYQGNMLRERIRPECFVVDALNRHFDPKEQIKLHLRNQKILNFIEFPFVLSLDYKSKLLDLETQIEHQVSMQRGMLQAMGGMIPAELLGMEITAVNLLYLQFEVHRSNLLDESLEKLSKVQTGLKNPLRIKFIGEPGDDGGGVKKEYFQLLVKEIFNPHRDMFVMKSSNRFYWFNGESFEAPIMFEFVGMLLGLSIYNRTLLNLSFPRLVYRKLLAKDNEEIDCLAELTDIEPDFQQSFRYILSTAEPLEPMELTFQAESEVFGEKVKHPLKTNGSHIRLTQSNKQEYVKLYSEWLVNRSVEKQFKAFRRGFYKVVTGNIIKIFRPEQLQRIICGDEVLDFKELEKVTKYQSSYSAHTPVVRALWDLVHSWDLETKKAFLFFTTGSDRAPIGGLGKLKFTVERHGPDNSNLPTAHTCSNVFLLPQYSNKHKLKEKLELALKHKEGFGLI